MNRFGCVSALIAVLNCGTNALPTRAQETTAVREVWLNVHSQHLERFPDSWRVVWERRCTFRPERKDVCVDGFVIATHDLVADTWDCEIHAKWTGTIALSEVAHEMLHCLQDIDGTRDFNHVVTDDQDIAMRAQDAMQAKGL